MPGPMAARTRKAFDFCESVAGCALDGALGCVPVLDDTLGCVLALEALEGAPVLSCALDGAPVLDCVLGRVLAAVFVEVFVN